MPYKDLEHDGDEDFFISDRKIAKKIKDRTEEEEKEKEKEEIERLQKKWLDFNNPALWNGEI